MATLESISVINVTSAVHYVSNIYLLGVCELAYFNTDLTGDISIYIYIAIY